jgi:acyl-CoA reductase-like NAD-dependent aldehyde dehydrogenase
MAKMFIGGQWVDSKSSKTTEIRNPANGQVVDTVPLGTVDEVNAAVDAAAEAFKTWSRMPVEQRANIVLKGIEAMEAHKDELALLLTREQGKPITEAKTEAEHFLHGMKFNAHLAPSVRGSYVNLPDASMYGMVLRQPIGVCAAIVPWNFPMTLLGTKIGPALVTGNTVVAKPSPTTPLTSLKIAELMSQAGLPAGTLNILTGPGAELGEALISHPKVRRVAFTGSTRTGKRVAEIAGRGIKRVTLELGGSDPMIVFPDADLRRASVAAAVGRYYNAGQMCLATKRLYVFDSVYDEFMQHLMGRVQKTTLGPGEDPKTRMGPLHMEMQRDLVEAQVADAVAKGAKVLAGGKRPAGDGFSQGFYFEPTLLTDVPLDSRMVKEEVFGPALPVWRVKDLDEAIELSNDSPYGLGATVFTRDLKQAREAAERLEVGNVWINSLEIGFDEMPFGGVKESGLGREHGPEALDGYLESKGVVIATG